MVFESRGHYVAPYTLLFVDGLFIPAIADVEESGADLKTHSEYDSFDLAQLAAMRFNEAIRLAYITSVPRALIEDVREGSFVRRIGTNGMPMTKTYRRGIFDNEKQKFPIVDPFDSDKKIFLQVGTIVAIEQND